MTADTSTWDGSVDLERDRQLVLRCQSGDRDAFDELFQRYQRRLIHFCRRRLHSNHDAEDAAQEAMAKAWRALPSFSGKRRFYPWLTVIANNVCTDMIRRDGRITPYQELPLQHAEADVTELDEWIIRADDIAIAKEALSHLSSRHQRVIALREGQGWSMSQIAEHEGVAVPAAESLLWRARQALRHEYAVLAESVGSFGAALAFGTALVRRTVVRHGGRMAAHTATWQSFRTPVSTALAVTGGMVLSTTVLVSAPPSAISAAPRPLALTAPRPEATITTPSGASALTNPTTPPASVPASSAGPGSSTSAGAGGNVASTIAGAGSAAGPVPAPASAATVASNTASVVNGVTTAVGTVTTTVSSLGGAVGATVNNVAGSALQAIQTVSGTVNTFTGSVGLPAVTVPIIAVGPTTLPTVTAITEPGR